MNATKNLGNREIPRVSIGLPVYNGENFLKEALDAILAQSFEDFELIITDNASTDGTEEICKTYAATDNRIRYYRNEKNLGATRNFNYAFELARGEYFKWAAHDDIITPNFLAKCVEILDQNSDVVLAYPQTTLIDEQGNFIKNYHYDGKLNFHAEKPQDRFHDLVCIGHHCYPIFGLMRSDALRKTPLQGYFAHADGVLLARLALLGRFYEIPEHMFLNRTHPNQSMSMFIKDGEPDYHQYTVWFDPSKKGKVLLPEWTIFNEYCKAIWESPISFKEKVACYTHIARLVKWWYWKGLVKDLVLLPKQIIQLYFKPQVEQPTVSQKVS